MTLVDGREPSSDARVRHWSQPSRQHRSASALVAGDRAGRRAGPRATLMSASMAAAHLLGGADAVIQADPGVPDRIPHRVGHRVDAPAPVVDEQQVHVAAGASSPRPYPPTASRATPLSSPAVARWKTSPQPVVGRRRVGRHHSPPVRARSSSRTASAPFSGGGSGASSVAGTGLTVTLAADGVGGGRDGTGIAELRRRGRRGRLEIDRPSAHRWGSPARRCRRRRCRRGA